MIIPDWQYPHWGTWWLTHACWTACSAPAPRPSIVVTLAPSIDDTGRVHERTARPFT